MHILAISGSLRSASSNTALLKAAARLAPQGVHITLCDRLSSLPHFNPDLDTDCPPAAVAAFRKEIGDSAGLLLCSPEYARGVAGVLKNALDWLVGSLEFPEKPVAVINTSARAVDADAQLRLILKTMSAHLIEDASITLPLLGRGIDAEGILVDADLSVRLRVALQHFARAIEAQGQGRSELSAVW